MARNTAVTHGIHVHVQSRYEPAHSSPEDEYYLFSYQVVIINKGAEKVQVLSRKWNIFDSTPSRQVVEGPGVVGKTPILKPGESFQYTSACELFSTRGKMKGEYAVRNLDTNELLSVEIPEFKLETKWSLN